MQLTDVHDIKPLEIIGLDPELLRLAIYSLYVILALTILGAGIYIWKKYRKRRIEKTAAPMLPHEAALQQLDKLSDIENIDGRVFYFELSAIVRNYIDGRFGIHAPEMTTEELLPRIDELDMAKEMQKELKELLRYSDPIKFAGFQTVVSTMKKDLFFMINFVKQTSAAGNHERNNSDGRENNYQS